MIEKVKIIFLMLNEMIPTSGIMSFAPVLPELYLHTYYCNSLNLYVCEYNSECFRANDLIPKVKIMFLMVNEIIHTLGIMSFAPVLPELYLHSYYCNSPNLYVCEYKSECFRANDLIPKAGIKINYKILFLIIEFISK